MKYEEEENLQNIAKVDTTKKYVRYEEGAKMYSMSLQSFMKLAKEAKAVYKIRRIVLVNVEKFEEYLETFRE